MYLTKQRKKIKCSVLTTSLTYTTTPQLKSAETATIGAQCLKVARTQGVQPGNEVPALRSHASEEVIGTTLCSLKPRPSEQLIVTLVSYHDNCHAYGQYGCDMGPM